jgi:hypothetical protein
VWIVKKCLTVIISYNQSLTVFLRVGTITSLCGHWLLDSFHLVKLNEMKWTFLDYKRMNVSSSVRWPPCIWIQCHIVPYSACVIWKLLILEWIIRSSEVWHHVVGRWIPKFWRNLLPPSSGYKVILKMEAAEFPTVWMGSNVHKQRLHDLISVLAISYY